MVPGAGGTYDLRPGRAATTLGGRAVATGPKAWVDLTDGTRRTTKIRVGGHRPVAIHAQGLMAWSPDGRWLFVVDAHHHVLAIDPQTGQLTVNFEFEECWSAPVWPAQHGAQTATQHLDVWVREDLERAVAWAVECGAREATTQPQRDVRVMIDPQGHPFCLFG